MQVQVRFSTKTDLVVSENVVKLPTDLAPNDLSNVINHMLTLDSAVQFEFLIDGQFLKTSLQKYLDSHNLSTENILEIEYIKATPPPSLEAQLDVEDWITDIHIGPFIACGFYDNTARIYNFSGQIVTAIQTEAPVKSIRWLNHSLIATGCQNGDLNVALFDEKNAACTTAFECIGHTASVNSIVSTKQSDKFITGSQDKTIRVWSLDNINVAPCQKKRKTTERQIQKLESVLSIDSHTDSITALSLSSNTIYSCSWDNSIRSSDIKSGNTVRSINTEKVLLSIDAKDSLVLAGSSDNLIRLYDFRSENAITLKSKFSAHSGFVSRVKWHPTNDFSFISASYDGLVNVWDTRSNKPVHSLTAGDKKLLGMDLNDQFIFTGGEDKKLSIFNCIL